MKDFDKETMLAWAWAMEHPNLYTMIEMSKPIAIALVFIGIGRELIKVLTRKRAAGSKWG